MVKYPSKSAMIKISRPQISILINNTQFNASTTMKGAIHFSMGTTERVSLLFAIIDSSSFTDNTVLGKSGGGAISFMSTCLQDAILNIQNTNFTRNKALKWNELGGFGGAIHFESLYKTIDAGSSS